MYKLTIKDLDGEAIVCQTFNTEDERDKFYNSLITGQNPILEASGKPSLILIKEDNYKGHWVEISRNLITN